MEQLPLYPFESAVMHRTQATIIPPVYYVEVTGKTGSLNPVIQLVNTRKIENKYLVIEVQGKDGQAIGTVQYERSIDVSQAEQTLGVIVKGAGKEVKLDWASAVRFSQKATVGLFLLRLQTISKLLGAPILHLSLGVDTVNKTTSGTAIVTQPLAQPLVCTSHVTGNITYEYVMKPGESKIRIDLTGYPEIHFPGGGIGPVILKNFTAMILLDTAWAKGIAEYQYLTAAGWVKETQEIELI